MRSIVTVAGLVLLGALLLGAPDAVAAPVDPDVVATAVVDRRAVRASDRGPGGRTWPSRPPRSRSRSRPTTPRSPTDPTDRRDPSPRSPPIRQPTEPTADQPVPAAAPVGRPRPAPAGVPVPARIDTGEGPGAPAGPAWWLIALPALALLGMTAGGAYRWIRRTERSAR